MRWKVKRGGGRAGQRGVGSVGLGNKVGRRAGEGKGEVGSGLWARNIA